MAMEDSMEHSTEIERAHWNGWAEGEQWVLDNLWNYVALRFRIGRWFLRARSWVRWGRAGRHMPYPMDDDRIDR